MRAFFMGFLHRPIIRICAVDEECHPAHHFDLFRCVAFYRFVIRD